MSVRTFVDEHYRHFNAGTLGRAARSLNGFLEEGGQVFVTLAGAMSTAEIGRTLAEMIRAGQLTTLMFQFLFRRTFRRRTKRTCLNVD